MALSKQCTSCGKTLPLEQFSKNSRAKDGKQFHCKTCNKKENLKFRTEINPEHHAKWQRENIQRHNEIVARFRRADKSSKIYYIKCKVTGLYYIGMSQMHLNVRFTEHKVKFNRWLKGKKTTQHPSLFESFKQYGLDNHEIGILFESENMDRKELREIEKAFIKSYKDLGLALNKQI